MYTYLTVTRLEETLVPGTIDDRQYIAVLSHPFDPEAYRYEVLAISDVILTLQEAPYRRLKLGQSLRVDLRPLDVLRELRNE